MTAVTDSGTDCGLALDEIPVGEGRAGVVDGEQVAVFRRRDGSVRALGARCPHRGGPLADGLTDDMVVVCPLHQRSYDLRTGAEAGGGPAATPWRAEVVGGRVRCSAPVDPAP